jgi:hypothetical protein
MLGYYKKHVLQLAEQLRALQAAPTNLDTLIETQLYILKRILATEGKIAEYRRNAAAVKKQLRSQRLSKDEAADAKRRMQFANDRIKACQWLLFIWRCFGDGIAFSYLDKWAVKPLLYNVETPDVKQTAGYLTGKEGLHQELAVVLEAKAHGVPALLCDLTNTIRHGDICLLGASDPYVIEVKSSPNVNQRAARQVDNITRIHEYFETDEAANVRGVPHVKRVELVLPEMHHREFVNPMIEEALREGRSVAEPEPGIRYAALAPTRNPDNRSILAGIEYPIIYFLNEAKNFQAWGCYYPFTLTITSPRSLYAFLNGDVILLVVFDFTKLQSIAHAQGMSLSILDFDGDWVYQLEKKFVGIDEPTTVDISRHFATRMAFEFLSWEWLLRMQEQRLMDFHNRIAASLA